MNKDEIIKALRDMAKYPTVTLPRDCEALRAAADLLAQPEQEPVAWLLTDKNINSLQVDSIQRLIDRLKHAHHTDIHVRINGHDEWFEADWLKHLTRTTPPQRTWVGLTDEDIGDAYVAWDDTNGASFADFARAIEAKLKQKNGYAEENT